MERPRAGSRGEVLANLRGQSYWVGEAPSPWSTYYNIKHRSPDEDDYVRSQPVHVTRGPDGSLITIPACQIRAENWGKNWVARECVPFVLPKYNFRSEEVPVVGTEMSSPVLPELKPLVIPLKVRSEGVPEVGTEGPSSYAQLVPPSVITYKRRPRSDGGHNVPGKSGAKAAVRRRQRFKSLVSVRWHTGRFKDSLPY